MDFFKRAAEQIRQMWANLTSSQRVIISAIAVAIVLLSIWGATAGAGDTMVRVVGYEVSQEMRNQILEQLDQDNQEYELRDLAIYVPRPDADRVILNLAGKGVMSGDAVWKFLEEDSIIASRWDKEKRFQIALQRRLESMLREMKPIKNASVILNPAVRTGRWGNRETSTASVQVELQHGTVLEMDNVLAIAGGVATVVPRLAMNQVHIWDTAGKAYRAHDPTSDEYKMFADHAYERQIERDLKKKIEFIMPPGSEAVITLVTERSKSRVEEKSILQGVDVESDISSFKDKGGTTGGVPGIKGEEALDSSAEGGLTIKNDKDEKKEKTKTLPSSKHTVTENPAGKIVSISAAVNWPIDAGEDGEVDEAELKRDQEKYRAHILAVLPAATTPPTVSLIAIPRRAPAPIPPTSMMDTVMEMIAAHWTKVVLVVLALMGLMMIFRVVRSAVPADMIQEIKTIQTRLDEEERASEQGEEGRDEVAKMKQGIRDMVERNPGGSGLIVNRWLEGR